MTIIHNSPEHAPLLTSAAQFNGSVQPGVNEAGSNQANPASVDSQSGAGPSHSASKKKGNRSDAKFLKIKTNHQLQAKLAEKIALASSSSMRMAYCGVNRPTAGSLLADCFQSLNLKGINTIRKAMNKSKIVEISDLISQSKSVKQLSRHLVKVVPLSTEKENKVMVTSMIHNVLPTEPAIMQLKNPDLTAFQPPKELVLI